MQIFFFNDAATTETYTLSLHDALPIFRYVSQVVEDRSGELVPVTGGARLQITLNAPAHDEEYNPTVAPGPEDRKSTRLNSSHSQISYAVFCLKKKTFRMMNAVSIPVSS